MCCLFLSGCQGFLDTAPYNQIASGNMWTSPDLADKGINGIYRALYNNDNTYTQPSTGMTGLNKTGLESLGVVSSGFYTIDILQQSAPKASFIFFNHEWKLGYTGIHRCNDALANMHKAGYDAETLEKKMCEVKFLRAFFYHRMNMLFQGVPIYKEPVNATEAYEPASSKEKVWELCLEDLTACIESNVFPDNNLTGSDYGRPSKGAAYALRGNIYMWQKEYQKAANDFEKVAECGFGLWTGKWDELFLPENEQNSEMIFPLQFAEDSGYSSNIQKSIGTRDQYDSWTEVFPAADFVDSFTYADGGPFAWTDIFPDWNELTTSQREVFFVRDGLQSSTASYMKTGKSNVEKHVGTAVMNKYYLDDGNEARLKKAYEGRDPRLQMLVYTPYCEVDCYTPTQNNGNEMNGKVFRLPYLNRGTNGGDLWHDKRKNSTDGGYVWFYIWRKYNESKQGRLIDRHRCYCDFPLIRYTDVLLQYAEALTELDRIGEAITVVNKIRTRADMPELTNGGGGYNGVVDKADMLRRIRYESRIELAVESVNYYHELRWGTWQDEKFKKNSEGKMGLKGMWGNLYINWYEKGEWLTRWPVPMTEQQRNSNLEQTPGWLY